MENFREKDERREGGVAFGRIVNIKCYFDISAHNFFKK